jgi:photosystem II stability/assembly factor-like uncharacterized protein
MTDDDLEQRLLSHFRAIDPDRAPRGLADRIGDAIEGRPSRTAFTVRTRPALAAAVAAVVIVGLGLGLGLRPGGFLTSAVTSPLPTATPASSKTSPGPSPTPSSVLPSATPAPVPAVSSVAFFDAAHGLVVGATTTGDAAVWRTSDGGRTWAETDLGMPGLAFVTVSAPSAAWATVLCPNPAWTGDTCSVIASSDGGVTWHSVSDRKLVAMSFVDAEHGWGFVSGEASPGGVGGLLSTADGGRTWTALPASPCREIGWLVSVSFVDRLHGWVGCAGMAGAGLAPKGVAETTDGGRTWTVRARVTPASGPVGSISITDYLEGIAMRPSGVGLAWEGRGGTLRTTDGGRTWTPMPPGGSDAGPIPAGGWAITDRDWLILLWDPNAQTTVLYATHDGGATWRAVSHVPGAP